MEPSPPPPLRAAPSPAGAERAPFSYGRRRSVWESAQSVADAARASTAVDMSSAAAHRSPGDARRATMGAGRTLDMVFAVHERARRHPCAEANALSGNRALWPPSQPAGAASDVPHAPPLLVEPVPSSLRPLRYKRSAGAWDAIAAGCAAEAKQLSEEENDVVAWAASFILSGDPRQGLLLLESYVIATCVLVFEQRRGQLSRASCVERHNELLLDWLQYRAAPRSGQRTRLPHCDVDPTQVTEAVVRHVVLQSMQLMDMVEVHRWYTVALVLCTSDETCNDVPDGGGKGGKARQAGFARTASFRQGSRSATQSPVAVEEEEEGRSQTPSFAALHTGHPAGTARSGTPTGSNADGAVSASDGYEAPSNMWFRYFFALCESSNGADAAPLSPGPGTPATIAAAATRWTPTVAGDPSVGKASASPTPTSVGGGQPSKLARTLSWFKDRGGTQGSELLGHRHTSGSFSVPISPSPLLTVPAWAAAARRRLDQEETAALLLAQCQEWDVFFITAVAAFHTQHYRTCMIAASRFLHWAEATGLVALAMQKERYPDQGGIGGSQARSTSPRPLAAPGAREYQCRLALLVRAWASLQLGERLQFSKDVVALLEYPEDSLCHHVGCAFALFGMPLPAAKETVMLSTTYVTGALATTTTAATNTGAKSAGRFSPTVQRYLYVLTESVHALTLLRLGMMRPAMGVAKAALARMEALRVRGVSAVDSDRDDAMLLGTLCDVVVMAATALEDAASVLDVPLSPHRLAYIAVSPAFFGGLCAGGIRVKPQSETHRLLYPANLPLYASTRQVIPFHMNRAVYLYHAGQLRGAWDDACCAVAAVDEVVGSVEFAFTDCFPLQVYHFACNVGFTLLESLLLADLEVAKACLSKPDDVSATEKKDATLREDEVLSKEIVHLCRDVVRRVQHFYPHSRLSELCQVQLSIMCGEKQFFSQAVLLADRYPHCPPAQNLLTLALYFDHHVPEAVDNAVKNLQAFPHSREVIRIHRLLKKKHVVYRFNYRGVLPTIYKPGSASRGMTVRMGVLMVLLAANLVVVCLTVYVNTPTVAHIPEGMRPLALRMQLPSQMPLFFAAVFAIHAIVAAATAKNLISTTLSDLFFVDNALNRAVFCLRCIPLVNVVNALLISIAGNNFLFDSGSATFVLYFFLSILFVPFTTRVWLLPSVDEPAVDLMGWLAILCVDVVTAFVVVLPHIILAVLEPYMFVVFFFYAPTPRPVSEAGALQPSSSVRRRLLLHAHYGRSMPPRFRVGSGSRFVHIRCLWWLYYRSHCSLETRYLAESQLEAENYRVFPMMEGEEARVLFTDVPLSPLCPALTSTEAEPPSGPPRRSSAQAWAPDNDAAQAYSPLSAGHHRSATGARLPASLAASTSLLSPPLAPSAPPGEPPQRRSMRHGEVEPGSLELLPVSPSHHYYTTAGGRRATSSITPTESDEELDATLAAGVRTVDALRVQLNRTARQRRPSLKKMASFVRATSTLTDGSTADDEDEDEDKGDGDGDGDRARGSKQTDTAGTAATHRGHRDIARPTSSTSSSASLSDLISPDALTEATLSPRHATSSRPISAPRHPTAEVAGEESDSASSIASEQGDGDGGGGGGGGAEAGGPPHQHNAALYGAAAYGATAAPPAAASSHPYQYTEDFFHYAGGNLYNWQGTRHDAEGDA
ncbi:hypothetical protein NESM_000178800 [Novymonas esmeraldas]|uniref:Uncharacterized protein n=1 Tax=Novymonas esmeraldas TaxID=1808958 RepID=A0AAW0F564_9TRYP